jgi:hypothetical protein
MELTLITPKEARNLLKKEKNGFNHWRVDLFLDLFKNHKFKKELSVIYISEKGRILNGKHLLKAIAMQEYNYFLYIKRNFSEDLFLSMSSGNRKTLDAYIRVKIKDITLKDSKIVSTALKYYSNLINNKLDKILYKSMYCKYKPIMKLDTRFVPKAMFLAVLFFHNNLDSESLIGEIVNPKTDVTRRIVDSLKSARIRKVKLQLLDFLARELTNEVNSI